jgi:hypothetical protein
MARRDGIESVLKHVACKLLDSRWERVAPLLLAICVIGFPVWISSGYASSFVVGYRTFIFKHQVDTPPLQLDPMKCSSAFSRHKVLLSLWPDPVCRVRLSIRRVPFVSSVDSILGLFVSEQMQRGAWGMCKVSNILLELEELGYVMGRWFYMLHNYSLTPQSWIFL